MFLMPSYDERIFTAQQKVYKYKSGLNVEAEMCVWRMTPSNDERIFTAQQKVYKSGLFNVVDEESGELGLVVAKLGVQLDVNILALEVLQSDLP